MKIAKIIDRYLIRESAVFFGICLFAFTSVLLTLKMLQLAALVIDKGVELSQIGTLFIAIVPTFLEIAIPLSSLLGIMLAFARLSGDSEIVVLRTSGIGIYRILKPVFLFGLISAMVCLYVSKELKPMGFKTLSKTLFEIARTKSTSGLEEGVFNKLGSLTVYSEKIDDRSGELSRVLIDDRRDKTTRQIITSATGQILSDEKSRTIIIDLRDGAINQTSEGRYTSTQFQTNRIVMGPDELFESSDKKHGANPSELSTNELNESIDYYRFLTSQFGEKKFVEIEDFTRPVPPQIVPQMLSREQLDKKLLRLRIERVQRTSLPFASFAMALLALPLGIQPPRAQRSWGAGISALLGMLVFVFYYGFFSIGVVLAQGKVISPEVALWIPNLCVISFAALAIHKTATEKWQSIAHAFGGVIDLVMRTLKREDGRAQIRKGNA